MNKLLTISEVAAILGVSVGAMRKWADSGQIPVLRLPGGHRRWSREHVAQIQEQIARQADMTPSSLTRAV